MFYGYSKLSNRCHCPFNAKDDMDDVNHDVLFPYVTVTALNRNLLTNELLAALFTIKSSSFLFTEALS